MPTANPAQAILDTLPAGVRPAQGAGLPEGVQPGHRYSYRCGGRMGTVYAQPDGAMTLKPGGVAADWITRNAHAASWAHATADCAGCA